jgi:hypothetical protein
VSDAGTTNLEVIAHPDNDKGRGLKEQLPDLLPASRALTRSSLRASLAVKNERLAVVLESPEQAGKVSRAAGGWQRLC